MPISDVHIFLIPFLPLYTNIAQRNALQFSVPHSQVHGQFIIKLLHPQKNQPTASAKENHTEQLYKL